LLFQGSGTFCWEPLHTQRITVDADADAGVDGPHGVSPLRPHSVTPSRHHAAMRCGNNRSYSVLTAA
jgi:hypothetical protein